MFRPFLHVLLLLLTLTGAAQAQTTTVSGRVLDGKDQSALIGANVLLTQIPDSVKRGAAVEVDGSFAVPGVPAGRYVLTVSFLGYQNLRRTVEVGAQPLNLGALTLQAGGGIALKGVEVVGQAAAAVQKGDTSQYNAAAFKTNPDANAQDLITKMPGVTIDPSTGRVQAQGEQVQRVLVDGKEFFGNDPDAVLKNLPAEVIDKIQVYDRASDQSQFTGFDDGNQQKTINIITKPNARNGKFGRVLAGYGPQDDRYRLSGNLNIFKGKQRFSIVAQSNNVNEQNFGTDDLLGVVGASRQGGGQGQRGQGGGRVGGGGGNNSGDFLVSQQGGISKTHALGLNYSDTWGTKTQVQGSYFFNLSDNTSRTNLLRQYVPTATQTQDLRYNELSLNTSRNFNNRFNLRLEHKFDSLNSLLWRPSVSVQRNTGNSLLDGNTLAGTDGSQGSNTSSYRSALTGLTANNQLLYRHRFQRRGRTFSLGLNTSYNDKTGDNNLLSSTTFFPDGQPRTTTLNQFSELDQTGWAWTGSVNYTEPLGTKSILQLAYNVGYTPNDSDKKTYDFSPGEQQFSLLNDTLSNVFRSRYLTNSGEVTYRYQYEAFQWAVGAAVQSAQLRSDQEFPRPGTTQRTFLNVLPNAQARYNFSKQQNLRLNYRANTNAPSISQLQEVVNNSNPLQLTTGNPNLRQESRHNVFLRYSSAVPEKSRSFFALLGGSYVNNYITNNTSYAGTEPVTVDGIVIPAGGQLTRPVNLNEQYSLRSFVNYSLPLGLLKSNLNLNANGNYSQTPGLVFGELNYSRTPTAGLGVGLSSNISPELDFTISSNSSQSYVRNTLRQQLNSQYFRQTTALRFSWIIRKGITLQSDVNHQLYSGLAAGFNQNFVLWNASLGKKLGASQQAELKLYAFDLLGQNNSIQRNIAAAYTEDVQTNILQRYFMVMFTYNLRSFGAGTTRSDALPDAGEGRGGRTRPQGFGPPPGGGQ